MSETCCLREEKKIEETLIDSPESLSLSQVSEAVSSGQVSAFKMWTTSNSEVGRGRSEARRSALVGQAEKVKAVLHVCPYALIVCVCVP